MGKRKYWILAGVLVVIIAALWSVWLTSRKTASQVRITIDGEESQIVPLDQNQTIQIKQDGAENTIDIKDGVVKMTYASCPDQLCLHQGSIHEAPESIVCLPNRVYVELVSDSQEGVMYDDIAQ